MKTISLRRKLTGIIMITSSTTLLLACLAVTTYDLVSFRQSMVRDLATLSEMLRDNTSAALIFGDEKAATEVLASLREQSHITFASVYTKDGKLLAEYIRVGQSRSAIATPGAAEGSYFTGGRLIDSHHIVLAGESVGTIHIESDVDEMNQRLRRYLEIVVAVIFSSSIFSFFLGSWLQRSVSGPILELAGTARRISAEKNYSLRAAGRGGDELGILVSGFNEMLTQIQTRDQELECQKVNLQAEVAARTEMNVELKTAKEAAEAASQAKGEFLANMSHEIRTPINGILGMTELTLDTELTQEQQDYLLMVRSSGESLLGVINDILDFSKVESGKLNLESIEFNLYNCVGETMKTLASRAHQKGLELAYDADPDIPRQLVGDPGRLRQILVNLVGNAIKFTEHGEVLVEVKPEKQTDGRIELHFSVTDTGIGISPEKQPLLFQAFSQADSSTTRRYGGTGLGLAISSRLVGLMGGEIWLESEDGRGSVFQFTASFGIAPANSDTALELVETELKGIAVLVVDDNHTNGRILSGVTGSWGMRASVVESGPAALGGIEEANAKGDPFRILLVDVCMPGMDGFALVRKIQDDPRLRGASILMLTSAGLPGEAALCKELGIAAYLLKPVLKADLMTAILTVLGQTRTRAAAAPALVTRHTLRESPRRRRILVAEDNLVNQAVVVRVLVKMGHSSVVAPTGEEALRWAMTGKFDLIFMDVQMPEMDGLTATKKIREAEKATGTHIPIFAMTAHAMTGDRERCLSAGMDGYISKPLRFSDIENALATLDDSSVKVRTAQKALDSNHKDSQIWDKAAALDKLGGDEELLQELLEIFMDECPKLLQKLREAVADSNADGVMRAAHGIKGEASYLGAQGVVEIARELECMGHKQEISGAAGMFGMLEAEITRLQHALQDPSEVRT